jgi:alpha-1,2-mannosyltransferase
LSRLAVSGAVEAAAPQSSFRVGRIAYAVGLAPLVVLAVVSLVTFVDGLNPGSLAFDFRGAYLSAADAVLDGESPYPAVEGPALASQVAYVYPPLLGYLVVPFTVLPETVAAVLAAVLVAGLLLATLVVLGVRDWRCYGAMLLWAPTVNAVHMASASALLAFAAALAWRYRAATWPLAGSIGFAIATKVILWPLLVWTLATRRIRATVLAVVLGGGITLALWATLSFDGLGRYPALMRRLTELEAEHSYSLVGAAAALGLGEAATRVVAALIGLALLVGCVVAARRRADLASFTLALAASLALSPIVWLHYFVLLVVPLAVARPRFSAVWLLPLLLWLTPLNGNGEAIQPLLPTLVAAALIAVVLSSRERAPVRVRPRPAPLAGSP